MGLIHLRFLMTDRERGGPSLLSSQVAYEYTLGAPKELVLGQLADSRSENTKLSANLAAALSCSLRGSIICRSTCVGGLDVACGL